MARTATLYEVARKWTNFANGIAYCLSNSGAITADSFPIGFAKLYICRRLDNFLWSGSVNILFGSHAIYGYTVGEKALHVGVIDEQLWPCWPSGQVVILMVRMTANPEDQCGMVMCSPPPR
jgi:hypothetical protein